MEANAWNAILQAVLQSRCQLAHTPLYPVDSDALVEDHRRSHRDDGGVIPLTQRLELPRTGVLRPLPPDAHVARPEIGGALAPDVQKPGLLGTDEPLVGAGGEEIAAHVVEVEPHGAEALRAVDEGEDPTLAGDRA